MSQCSWFTLQDLTTDCSFVDFVEYRGEEYKLCSLVFKVNLTMDVSVLKEKTARMFYDPCAVMLQRGYDYQILLINELPNIHPDPPIHRLTIAHTPLKRYLPDLVLVDDKIPFLGHLIQSNLCIHAIMSCCFQILRRKSTEVGQRYNFYLNNELATQMARRHDLEERIQLVDDKFIYWDRLCDVFEPFEAQWRLRREEIEDQFEEELAHAADMEEKQLVEEIYREDFAEIDEELESRRRGRFRERDNAAVERVNETRVCESMIAELDREADQLRTSLHEIHQFRDWSQFRFKLFLPIPQTWHKYEPCDLQLGHCVAETFNDCAYDLIDDPPTRWYL